jgi:mannose-6-phosphate isomerase-like protein (cupin superfamily)
MFSRPEHEVFKVVSYPEQIYHAVELNATCSPRYRYVVRAVQNKSGVVALKAEVFLDAHYLCNVLRLEYRAGRLLELARQKGRRLGNQVLARVRLLTDDSSKAASGTIRLTFDPELHAYQAEIWVTLEAPPTGAHAVKVLAQMGRHGAITARPEFRPALRDLRALHAIEVVFGEDERESALNRPIRDPVWDKNYERTDQVPNAPEPDAPANTVPIGSYFISFQKGKVIPAGSVAPVRYRNPAMDADNPDRRDDNIIDIRWLLQHELGARVVYLHEVTLPPKSVEGVRVYVGAEVVYYVVEGEGIAYLGAHDDPATADRETVLRAVLGAGFHHCKAVPIRAGDTVYGKNGALQGIANPGDRPLRIVRFGAHIA